MEEEEIDVVNYEASSKLPDIQPEFRCTHCEWIGKSERSLSTHLKYKHPGTEPVEEGVRRTRGRPRKKVENGFGDDVFQQRVTTKQLLGGRKRPKTIVDNVDDSALRTDREASRLHELGVIDEETPLGEFVRRGVNYQMISQEMMGEDGGAMVVGEEVVIGDGEQIDEDDDAALLMKYDAMKNRLPGRRYAEKLPDRLTHGDPTGKYKCYIAGCQWKGGYRSVRMDHMKAIHPNWKMPSRYILERISKEGVYIDPEKHEPKFACNVEGCDWRGNYRASRSTHMRKVHPEEHASAKKKAPGYNCNGNYACHFPMCSWRGWSRSTRSQHLKKAHPDWRPEDNRIMMALSCFYCKNIFNSYDQLCNHIANHGGLILQVDEVFDSKQSFGDWLQNLENTYSITFERNELTHPSEDVEPEVKNYILHCNCTSGKGAQLASDSRNYIYQKHHYLKRRSIHMVTRLKIDCSVHLEIREDSPFGPVHVKGCLEHTGHRFGTPLLRLSAADRQLYLDIEEWKAAETENFHLTALNLVERLNTFEGFMMDNYAAAPPTDMIDPYDEDPLISLRQLIDQSDPGCFFGKDFSEGGISFGYVTQEMAKLYKAFGPEKIVTIDGVTVEFDDMEVMYYSVLVNDENTIPRCALFYVSTDYHSAPDAILHQLSVLDPRPPKEIIADVSEVWVELSPKYWGEKEAPAMLISEWNLMDYWASKVEMMVDNEFDLFCIISALRRFLRVDELHQMQAFIVEFFEALYECGYEAVAEFLDIQLTDAEFQKRWSPLQRTLLTSHAWPTTGVAARILRDLYLTHDDFARIDQWFAHVTKRIHDFNDAPGTEAYTFRIQEAPRKFFYNQVATDENGMDQELVGGVPEDYRAMIYEDDILAGEVVEEEIIGHEITEEETVEMEEVVGEGEEELNLQEGEEIIYEEIEDEHQQIVVTHHHHLHQTEEYERNVTVPQRRASLEYEDPAPGPGPSSSRVVEPDEGDAVVLEEQRQEVEEIPRKIPPHRRGVPYYTRNPPKPTTNPSTIVGNETLPLSMPRRETTKAVIRRKKNKEKYAHMRDCPPEVMRAIAAHAISYDGRKKEQRPFMYMPSEAKMSTATTPVVATPDLKPFEKKMTPQEIALIQQRRREKKDQQWARFRHTTTRHHPEEEEEIRMKREPVHDEHDVVEYKPDVHHSSISSESFEEEYAPESMVVHHEEIHMDHNEPDDVDVDDDQQPCTSASMYR